MTQTEQSPPDIEALVAASLVRSGTDTRAQRLFKDEQLGRPGGGQPVRSLCALLEARQERRAEMERLAHSRAAAAMVHGRTCSAVPLAVGHPGYPSRLMELPDPPIVLWAMGHTVQLGRPAVAIVGSRRATPGGLAMARRLARDLAAAGLVVVSGMALGVDAAAHEGALEGGGVTIAVLGSGIDVVYPRNNGNLIRRLLGSGCVVSELPPGALPLPRHFPLRNRLISGLSLAVVVVEAAERSGSLITARMALEQGRDVLAVPGPVVSGCHRGCHALIKDGAGLVETADDVLAALGWRQGLPDRPAGAATGLAATMTVGAPVTVDELAGRANRPAAELLAELGALEIAGKVARMPGGLFVRLD